MQLFPKKVKHRKWHTMRTNPKKVGMASRGTTLSFGSYGLKATTPFRMRSNQIESARKVVARAVSKTGKMWIRVFPDKPYTQKPAEVKMGKGKGDPQGYEVQILPGHVIFEVDGIGEKEATEALKKAGAKLPVKSRVISRTNH
jgi:large subunit ribosomal protein L16